MRNLLENVYKAYLLSIGFSKECVRCCVQHTHNLELIKELLGFFLVANDETRKNVTHLIKEAITSTIKITSTHTSTIAQVVIVMSTT